MSKQSKGVTKELFFYPNKQAKTKRITVAGAIIGETIRIGRAIQRPGEVYNRRIGRGIALGRAVSSPELIVPIETSPTQTLATQFISLSKQLLNISTEEESEEAIIEG